MNWEDLKIGTAVEYLNGTGVTSEWLSGVVVARVERKQAKTITVEHAKGTVIIDMHSPNLTSFLRLPAPWDVLRAENTDLRVRNAKLLERNVILGKGLEQALEIIKKTLERSE